MENQVLPVDDDDDDALDVSHPIRRAPSSSSSHSNNQTRRNKTASTDSINQRDLGEIERDWFNKMSRFHGDAVNTCSYVCSHRTEKAF